MINIMANHWLRLDRQLPQINQPVLVCDIFPGEQNRAHLVTFTGQLHKEWRNELSGNMYSLDKFTYWIPLQIEFPAFTPEQEIACFQDLLNTVADGVSFTIDLTGTLSEDYVRSQIAARARIEQLGHDIQLAQTGRRLLVKYFRE